MLANFTRPKEEKPYYFSSTVENGKVIKHEGDMNHAVYLSEVQEIQRRADLWHKWVEANVPHAYSEMGVLDEEVMFVHSEVRRQFMEGERSE